MAVTDRVKAAGRLLFNIGWAASELAVAAFDVLTRRRNRLETDRRRFMDAHPDVIFYDVSKPPRPPA